MPALHGYVESRVQAQTRQPAFASAVRPRPLRSLSRWVARTIERFESALTWTLFLQLTAVFLAYYVAGKLGQATTNIRSSNIGPVWPAYGIALAALLAYGYRVWPAVAVSAFVVAAQGGVPLAGAAGQAAGATIAVASGTFLLQRLPGFDPSLPKLRDALGLIVVGAFGSALVSSSIGIASLYATGIQPYSGLTSAWLIYWLGDATGALLVTPLVFTASQLLRIRSWARIAELGALVTLVTAICFVVFGDLPLIPVRLDPLAFGVLPLVMWGAIQFGIAGAALSLFLVATFATLLTALGLGPFSVNTPLVNAVLLDVLFAVLAISGLSLAAVMAERLRAEGERERLMSEKSEMEARLHLAAIVESSDDAIVSEDLEGVILSWNRAATRILGFTEEEAVGKPISSLIPSVLRENGKELLQRLRAGERIAHVEAAPITQAGQTMTVASTISPLTDAAGAIVGFTRIIRDVTEKTLAEEALSGANRRLIETQERERARIARELHDDIGQRLAFLAMNLNGLSKDLEMKASELAVDVQALSHELHPSWIELLGIAQGAKRFCQEFADQHKVTVDFDARDIPDDLPSSISLSLFRILQEALRNSAKHSGVRQCEVRLWEAEDTVHLVVSDRGAGFDVNDRKGSRGIGLVSMRERVKLVDGTLSIESHPRRGTTIHARVPFRSLSRIMNR